MAVLNKRVRDYNLNCPVFAQILVFDPAKEARTLHVTCRCVESFDQHELCKAFLVEVFTPGFLQGWRRKAFGMQATNSPLSVAEF